MNILNKTFLVTGAGGGIGKALALELLKRGAKVAAVDLRKESLDALIESAEKDSVKIKTYATDITDKKAVEGLPEKVIADFGSIDGLINNAGIIQPFVKINELDYDAIERVMNVNFYGLLYMTKSFLPHLLKRPEGYIANVSSMGGFLPVPGQSVYGASKAAVKLLTEGLYAEMAGTNVSVSIVFPGATETNISANSGVKIHLPKNGQKQESFPMTTPEEAAKVIANGIEKNQFQIFIGKDCNFMNSLYRINPCYATNFIAKKMKSLLD